MRILIVSAFLCGRTSPRVLRTRELALELSRRGHEVTVVTSTDECEPDFAASHRITVRALGRLTWRKPSFGRSRVGRLLSAAVSRLLQLLLEYPNLQYAWLVRSALRDERGYDLLISIAQPYPIHWGVASIWSRRLARTWVADCGDPYALLENDGRRKWVHFHWIEKWFMRKCDYITIPIESARSAYFPEFADKLQIIPQGLSFPEPAAPATPRPHREMTFAYAGDIYPYQNYAKMFLQDLTSVQAPFRFLIYSKGLDFFERHLDPSIRERCTLHDRIERYELLTQLRAVDFLVYFPYRHESQQPFKLIDYTYADRPILCYRGDADSRTTLHQFLAGRFDGDRVRRVDLDKHRITSVVDQFLALA